MELIKKKETCSPCAQNAALSIGDAICHKSGRRDCHTLADAVRRGSLSVDDYLNRIEREAEPEDRQQLRKIKSIIRGEHG